MPLLEAERSLNGSQARQASAFDALELWARWGFGTDAAAALVRAAPKLNHLSQREELQRQFVVASAALEALNKSMTAVEWDAVVGRGDNDKEEVPKSEAENMRMHRTEVLSPLQRATAEAQRLEKLAAAQRGQAAPNWEIDALTLLADVQIGTGDVDAAEKTLDQADRLPFARDSASGARILLDRAAIALLGGDMSVHAHFLDEADALAERTLPDSAPYLVQSLIDIIDLPDVPEAPLRVRTALKRLPSAFEDAPGSASQRAWGGLWKISEAWFGLGEEASGEASLKLALSTLMAPGADLPERQISVANSIFLNAVDHAPAVALRNFRPFLKPPYSQRLASVVGYDDLVDNLTATAAKEGDLLAIKELRLS